MTADLGGSKPARTYERSGTTAPGAYRVGDPDPTLPESDHQCLSSPDGNWLCTWPKGHDGPHVAGDGDEICAVWETPQSAPYSEDKP